MDTLLASVNSLKDSLAAMFKGKESGNADLISAFEARIVVVEGALQAELLNSSQEIAALKTENTRLLTELSAATKMVDDLTAAQSDFAAKLKNGIAVGVMEAASAAGISALPIPKETGANTMARGEWAKLPVSDQGKFIRNGGKLTD